MKKKKIPYNTSYNIMFRTESNLILFNDPNGFGLLRFSHKNFPNETDYIDLHVFIRDEIKNRILKGLDLSEYILNKKYKRHVLLSDRIGDYILIPKNEISYVFYLDEMCELEDLKDKVIKYKSYKPEIYKIDDYPTDLKDIIRIKELLELTKDVLIADRISNVEKNMMGGLKDLGDSNADVDLDLDLGNLEDVDDENNDK